MANYNGIEGKIKGDYISNSITFKNGEAEGGAIFTSKLNMEGDVINNSITATGTRYEKIQGGAIFTNDVQELKET